METSELIDFHNDFVPIWQKYQSSIKLISINNDSKSSSLEDVISLTNRRLEISKKYFDDFKALKIPDVLKSFYKSSTEFIESDINLWETILAYYNMNNPEQFDASTIEELGNESKKLYEKANKELMEIYDTHSLGYFFKEYE